MFGRKKESEVPVLDGEGEVMPDPPKRRKKDQEEEPPEHDVSGGEPQGSGPWKNLFKL